MALQRLGAAIRASRGLIRPEPDWERKLQVGIDSGKQP